jgi:hypothetical protein
MIDNSAAGRVCQATRRQRLCGGAAAARRPVLLRPPLSTTPPVLPRVTVDGTRPALPAGVGMGMGSAGVKCEPLPPRPRPSAQAAARNRPLMNTLEAAAAIAACLVQAALTRVHMATEGRRSFLPLVPPLLFQGAVPRPHMHYLHLTQREG